MDLRNHLKLVWRDWMSYIKEKQRGTDIEENPTYLGFPEQEKGRAEVTMELILAEHFLVHFTYKSHDNHKTKSYSIYTKDKDRGI